MISWALTERRSLMHHLNHLYIFVLWHNGPNLAYIMLGSSFRWEVGGGGGVLRALSLKSSKAHHSAGFLSFRV